MGIEFPNPVGLAAGLDKNGDYLPGLARLGLCSNNVLTQTVNNAQSLGYQISLLETIRDIDTLADINHYPALLSLIDDSPVSTDVIFPV